METICNGRGVPDSPDSPTGVLTVGFTVGFAVGAAVGSTVGIPVAGVAVGFTVGFAVGDADGPTIGIPVAGVVVGAAVGSERVVDPPMGAIVDGAIVGSERVTEPPFVTGAIVGSEIVAEPPEQASNLHSGPVRPTVDPSGQVNTSNVQGTGSEQGKKTHPFSWSRTTREPSSHCQTSLGHSSSRFVDPPACGSLAQKSIPEYAGREGPQPGTGSSPRR